MATFVSVSSGEPSVAFRDLVRDVERVAPRASAARDENGGVKRRQVLESIDDGLCAMGFRTGGVALRAPSRVGTRTVIVDAFHAATHAALQGHAGRAWMNHEATVAVLRMAAAADVRNGILLVPDRYKGSEAAANILSFLRELSTSDGIRLDIDHVAVITY